jgi:hypothetical protein
VNRPVRDRITRRTGASVIAGFLVFLLTPTPPASAQNLFEALFGAFLGGGPQTRSYPDPRGPAESPTQRSGGFGHGTVYCVRTCDGRYFPLQRHAGASAAELCHSFCPASKTMIFTGSKIDHAVAANGARYADLDSAFAYRQRVVDNCTCNGRDGLGLAHLDTATDPTLRPGDIVATNNGLATFRGTDHDTARFTPIGPSSGEWARKLSEIKVRAAPPDEATQPFASNAEAQTRGADRQAAR